MAGKRPIADLAFRVSGAGSPVALFHGFAWSAQGMAALGRLIEPFHTVIAFDLPGHGATGPPPPGYRMGDMAADLDAVLTGLGYGRVHLCGYSMGGRIALSYADAAPARVASLVLIGASAGIRDDAARAERASADDALAARITRDGVSEFLSWWAAQPLLLPATQRGRDALEASLPWRLENDAAGLAAALRRLGTGRMPPLHDRLHDLDLPVAAIAGEHDRTYRSLAADLAAALPAGRAFVVPDAGHAAHLDDPQAVADIALGAFAGAERSAA